MRRGRCQRDRRWRRPLHLRPREYGWSSSRGGRDDRDVLLWARIGDGEFANDLCLLARRGSPGTQDVASSAPPDAHTGERRVARGGRGFRLGCALALPTWWLLRRVLRHCFHWHG